MLSTELPTATGPAAAIPIRELGELACRLEEWRSNKSAGYAGDLLSSAFVLGDPDVFAEVASVLASGDIPPTSAQAILINTRLAPGSFANESSGPREMVARAKCDLAAEPRNPLLWLELARFLTILGSRVAADRAMRIALAGAPDNRFILRSAARLAVHVGEPDRAHHLLSRSSRLTFDPWLLAAEIAVASLAGKASRCTKKAAMMLEAARFGPKDLSELAAALATEEMIAGRHRFARRMFMRALDAPTDNVVAQVLWANRQGAGVNFANEHLLTTPRIFEAEAIRDFFAGRWESSLNATLGWLRDEPFSSKPAIQGSYVAAVALERYEESVALAKQGLQANPTSFSLLNNLAFALAELGMIDEAAEAHALSRRHSETPRHHVVASATGGLIAYRGGDPLEGELRYRAATEQAAALRDERLSLSVAAFSMIEALGGTIAPSRGDIGRMIEALREASYPECVALAERLERRFPRD